MKIRRVLVVLATCFCGHAVSAQSMDYSPGFIAGKPDEMKSLDFLVGEFEIDLFFPTTASDGTPQWNPWAKTAASIEAALGGAILAETNNGFPIAESAIGADGLRHWQYFTVWSYDRFNQTYRAAISDNVLALTDIYEGNFSGDTLILSNLNTDTYNNMGSDGGGQKNRIVLEQQAENVLVVTWYTLDVSSINGTDVDKQAWVPSVQMRYVKQ